MLFVAGTHVVFGIIHLKASKNATFVAVQRQRWEAELLDDANFKAILGFCWPIFRPILGETKSSVFAKRQASIFGLISDHQHGSRDF